VAVELVIKPAIFQRLLQLVKILMIENHAGVFLTQAGDGIVKPTKFVYSNIVYAFHQHL